MAKVKLTKEQKRERDQENFKQAWLNFKTQLGNSDSIGKGATNAGFAIIKGIFSIAIAIIIFAIGISLLTGE